ncbi:MAG: hypothetical protein ACREA0_14920 [bacterium]
MYTSSDSGVERSEGARPRMLWQTTPQGLRCRWVPGETPADPSYRRAAVNAHDATGVGVWPWSGG